MFAAAVGAFDLEEIDVLDGLGIAENIVVAAAHVATEKVAKDFGAFPNVENDLGGTENVASVAKGCGEAVGDLDGAIVIEGDELANGFLRVNGAVKGFDGREAFAGALF